MGKSIIRIREEMAAEFLLVMPEGTFVRSASVDPEIRGNVLLQISGRPVPNLDEVVPIINTGTVDGKRVRWLTFEAPKPVSPIIMPDKGIVLNG